MSACSKPGARTEVVARTDESSLPVSQAPAQTEHDDLYLIPDWARAGRTRQELLELQKLLEQKMREREELLLAYLDRRPKEPLNPKRHALSAFSTGFQLNGATIHLSEIGCTVEVRHRGRTYVETLHEFGSCRLAERGDKGHTDIRRVKGRPGRGVMIVELTPDPENHRCRRLSRSLRILKSGPRISRASSPISMCNYRGLDTMHYEILSYDDHPMPKQKDVD